MKRLRTTTAGLLLGICSAACTEPPAQRFTGIITGRTHRTVTVKTPTADHGFAFALANADTTHAYGLPVGAPVVVEYRGELAEETPALRVEADSTYAAAIGRWTAPDPANPERASGFELLAGGKARPIHTQTQELSGWELESTSSGRIRIRGRSIGLDQITEFCRTATLARNASGVQTLTTDDGTVYTKWID